MALDIILLLLFAVLVLRYSLRIREAMIRDPQGARRWSRSSNDQQSRFEWKGQAARRASHQDPPREWPRPDVVEDVRWRTPENA